jgi:ribonuclease VapC
MISSPNFAEALTKILDRKPELRDRLPEVPWPLPDEEVAALTGMPLAGGAISVEPFTIADAILCAWLRQPTRRIGLSLGDRACLALGRRLGLPVLTADREWAAVSVGVEVRLIR